MKTTSIKTQSLLRLAIVFAIMDVAHIDLHRISLGALIIALTLLVDDAMTTVDAMIRRLGAGDASKLPSAIRQKTSILTL